ALQQKNEKDLTDDDKKRIKAAEEVYAKAQQAFAVMKEDRDRKLREYITTNSESLMKSVRQAVAKVAEQKGLSIVFNSEVVLHAGVDITAPVITELNKTGGPGASGKAPNGGSGGFATVDMQKLQKE